MKKESVHQIFTENETKSNFAERSIQNLENRLHRMFAHNQSYKYLNIMPSITEGINNTPSRPLGGFAPADVTKKTKTKFDIVLIYRELNMIKDHKVPGRSSLQIHIIRKKNYTSLRLTIKYG